MLFLFINGTMIYVVNNTVYMWHIDNNNNSKKSCTVLKVIIINNKQIIDDDNNNNYVNNNFHFSELIKIHFFKVPF